jgi:hypothetical protein
LQVYALKRALIVETFGRLLALQIIAALPPFIFMAGFAHDAQHEFWQSPAGLDPALQPAVEPSVPPTVRTLADACAHCGSEYMISAAFCHVCGRRRLALKESETTSAVSDLWVRPNDLVRPWIDSAISSMRKLSFPRWLRYLHFHEIKRSVGLPTPSLVAFIIGLGCVVGALCLSLFYKASNLAEFEAIQMWRIEWLLAATASFVAGILLKHPSDSDAEDE